MNNSLIAHRIKLPYEQVTTAQVLALLFISRRDPEDTMSVSVSLLWSCASGSHSGIVMFTQDKPFIIYHLNEHLVIVPQHSSEIFIGAIFNGFIIFFSSCNKQRGTCTVSLPAVRTIMNNPEQIINCIILQRIIWSLYYINMLREHLPTNSFAFPRMLWGYHQRNAKYSESQFQNMKHCVLLLTLEEAIAWWERHGVRLCNFFKHRST